MDAKVAEKAKKFLEEIAAHIDGATVVSTPALWSPYDLKVERDGVTLYPLNVSEVETGSDWCREGIGKLSFSIKGAHNMRDTKTFRELKDGTLNPKFFEDLEWAIFHDVDYAKQRNNEALAQSIAKQTLEGRNIKPYDSRIRAIKRATPSFKVEFEITIDDLDRVLNFLDSLDPIYQEE